MAVYRPTPTCHHCGAPTHEAIYLNQSHLPPTQRLIGDTFEGWKHLEHMCDGLKKEHEMWVKTLGEIIDDED